MGDLTTLPGENLYDAVTMWCVLAHVTDPDTLLRDALRVLKPGGILFLQTPRWSVMDAVALGVVRSTGGRFARVLDRRVNEYHMTLNSRSSLTAQATRTGFEVVEIHPRARYSLQTHAYLSSMGLGHRASRLGARVLDTAVDRGFFFRNVLDLYARKPLTPDPSNAVTRAEEIAPSIGTGRSNRIVRDRRQASEAAYISQVAQVFRPGSRS
jgi:SAM-dependent methyltransferase